ALVLLEISCAPCHGDKVRKFPGLNVHDLYGLLRGKGTRGLPFLTPGSPEKSELLLQVRQGDMPKDGPPFTGGEVAILERWIREGARFPKPQESPRPHVSEQDVLQAEWNYLATVPGNRRQMQRFFTLANVHNDPGVNEATLRLYRAALSKAINSLT